MRYFLDTEYNGFGGQLLSIALAPEHGDQEFYATFPLPDDLHPWVVRHVVPYLQTVPPSMHQQMSFLDAGAELARYLAHDAQPVIVADWPDDIAYFCSLLTPSPGEIVPVGSIAFLMMRTPGFSTAANSSVPHNALHDARALRDFALEEDTFAK
ncbi:hypothetical protein [Rhizorhapis sp. SPR117]|uniref:hypothetical protein n=1 Tax=Rhizorhapis sp. SPR117 TaxID=2912611 RepID=UPI001F24B21E|nr:hypothetical protein [Rhizorhapis sp. SPR117]